MVQSYLSWELVSSLIKDIDKCGKLEKVANTQKSNQKTKVSWCWNGEWKPTMSNAGWMHVNSCTEVRKPSIQLQDGKMCLHSWAFTESVSTSALEMGGFPWWLRWKRIHLQLRTFKIDPWVGKIPQRRKLLPLLAWRIPWAEEPGRPQSTESQSQIWLSV